MRESPRISIRSHKFEGEQSLQRPCDIKVKNQAKNKKQRAYRRGKARFITNSPQAVASRTEVLHQAQYGASAEAFLFPPGKKKPDAGFYNDIHSKTLLSSSLFYIADSPHIKLIYQLDPVRNYNVQINKGCEEGRRNSHNLRRQLLRRRRRHWGAA